MKRDTLILVGEPDVHLAVKLLKAGQCVALPTETVYGLAADASNETAVSSIFAAKGRPANHPLIVHLAAVDQVKNWAIEVPDTVAHLAEAFWPGPLTLLLRKGRQVSAVVTGGHQTIALRVPEHPLFLKVLGDSGLGLAAPSANRYKKLSPTRAEQVLKTLNGRISAVLDGGPCEFGLESTILDLTSTTPTIVRSGPVGRTQLEAVLGCKVTMPVEHKAAVPGNVEAHYQPNARLQLAGLDQLKGMKSDDVGIVIYSQAARKLFAARLNNTVILENDPFAFGHDLYSALHKLDDMGVNEIFVECPPFDESWAAVSDRLKRASGGAVLNPIAVTDRRVE